MSSWPPELIAHIRSMLPPIEELTSIENPKDMGPNAAIPAVYVHLLLLRIEALEEMTKLDRVRFVQLPRHLDAPSDSERDDYAGQLGKAVMASFRNDPDVAVSTMLQATAAVLVANYDPQFAAQALKMGASVFSDEIRRNFLPSGLRQ